MVEDSKMTDETTPVTPVTGTTTATPLPLVAAAVRLEKILSDHIQLEYYTNPVKVVRRWLGTSSGAAKTVLSVSNLQLAVQQLLDPRMELVAPGRALLLSGNDPMMMMQDTEAAATATATAADVTTATTAITNDTTTATTTTTTVPSTYLTTASAREVECWLCSLMVRCLWQHHQWEEAIALAHQAIAIAMQHLLDTSSSLSSMFPLLARLYRFLALAVELSTSTASSSDNSNNNNHTHHAKYYNMAMLSQAHNLATVRRDVDTQATVLNIMLRDLLRRAQGTCVLRVCREFATHEFIHMCVCVCKCYWSHDSTLQLTHVYSRYTDFSILIQSNPHKSYCPIRPFQKRHRTINIVAFYFTVVVFKRCDWNIRTPFRV
jgi:hypothetical protein